MVTARVTWSLFGASAIIAWLMGYGACSSASPAEGYPDASADGTTGGACTKDADCAALVPPTDPPGCASGTCSAGVCRFSARDVDGDGHRAAHCSSTNGVTVVDGDDCNDHDPNLYPGHPEACILLDDGGIPAGDICVQGQVSCLSSGGESPCQGTFACPLGSSCVAGDAGVPSCIVPACSAGRVQCNHDVLQVCDSTGTWIPQAPCPPGEACDDRDAGHVSCAPGCYVGGGYQPPSAIDPSNACQSCAPDASSMGWTLGADGTRCKPPGGAAGYSCCAGTCTSSATDAKNCGRCGLACNAGPSPGCGSGLCYYAVAVTGLAEPLTIAVDSTSVYWGSSDDTVMKVPRGGGATTTLASGQNAPWGGIAVDATNVYWTDVGAGTVMKAPLGGGLVLTVAAGQVTPHAIAVDANAVYWVNMASITAGGAVMKVPLAGGNATMLAPADLPHAIALDATNVYWTEGGASGAVASVPIGGGTTTTLVSGLPQLGGIAVDGARVYWDVESCGNGMVMSRPLGGGSLTTLASGQPCAYGIAIDASNAYWFTTAGIMKVPLGGGTPATVAAGPGLVAGQVAVDATNVYWTATVGIMTAPK